MWLLTKAPFSDFLFSLQNPSCPCQFFSFHPEGGSLLKCSSNPAFPLFKILQNFPQAIGIKFSVFGQHTGHFPALGDLPVSLPPCTSSAAEPHLRQFVQHTHMVVFPDCICCSSTGVTLLYSPTPHPISLTCKWNHLPHAKLCHPFVSLKVKPKLAFVM